MKHTIEYLAPEELIPYAGNARKHPQKQIRQIAKSIKAFGFNSPLLITSENRLLAGHGRLEAAKSLGLATVPCVRLDHLTDVEQRGYILADNRTAEGASWDEVLLAEELTLIIQTPDLGFDLDAIGFSIAEVDASIEGLVPQEAEDPADDRLPEAAPRRCEAGDIWQLGQHRLICGDALDPEVVARLMQGARARMVFTDPPYNVPIQGHVGGGGKIRHREFAMAAGEMSEEAFTAFLSRAMTHLANHSHDGAIHLICMDWRHMGEMLKASAGIYSELKNLIVWAKDNGGMGTFYRSRHELIFAFKVGSGPHVNSFELGQHGRYRTNLWQYKGVNTMRAGRMEELSAISTHGTVWLDCIAEGLWLILTPHGGGDEEEPRDDEGTCRAGCEGYPARDAQAAFV